MSDSKSGNSLGDGRPAILTCKFPPASQATDLRISKLRRHLIIPNHPSFQGGPLGCNGWLGRLIPKSEIRTLFSRILIGRLKFLGLQYSELNRGELVRIKSTSLTSLVSIERRSRLEKLLRNNNR